MSKPKRVVKIAVIQAAPVYLNMEASLAKARSLIAEAAQSETDIVVFPETWLPGYPIWVDLAPGAALWDHGPAKELFRLLYENSPELTGETVATLVNTAVEHNVYVMMGLNERRGATLYNTMLFCDRNGSGYRFHRKLIPTHGERLIWGRGDGSSLAAFPTDFGIVGGLICWEHWMPLARAAMHAQHEILHIAQWPAVTEMHGVASRHYAFEGGCFVAAAGCALSQTDILAGAETVSSSPQVIAMLGSMGGGDGEWRLTGGSAIIAPDGRYLTAPAAPDKNIVYAELDLSEISERHMTLDTDGHYARPDIFSLRVNQKPQRSVDFYDDPDPSNNA